MFKISLLLILIIYLTRLMNASGCLTYWEDYSSNPVFDPSSGVRAYYPSVLYDENAFSGHGDSSYYKMWYSDGSSIGYATSNDGIHWTDHGSVTGLTNAYHAKVIYDENGFGGSGVYYKVWYWASVNYIA